MDEEIPCGKLIDELIATVDALQAENSQLKADLKDAHAIHAQGARLLERRCEEVEALKQEIARLKGGEK